MSNLNTGSRNVAQLTAWVLLSLAGCAATAPATPIDSPYTTSAAMKVSTGAHHPVETVPLGTAGDHDSPPPFVGVAVATTPAPQADAALTDAQIATIATELHQAEIDEATLALVQAQNPKVRAFAFQMVSVDANVDRHLSSVVQNENLAPTESNLGTSLKSDDLALKRSLAQQTGAAFDEAYISAQVKGHESALHLFDETLIPGARNPALKTALQTSRARLIQHIVVAKQAVGALPQN